MVIGRRRRGRERKALAKALKVSPQRISQLVRRGMPTTSVRKAKAWVAANVQRRTGAVSSSVERLRAAQAKRAELEYSVRAGELLPLEHVTRFTMEAIVTFTSALEGIPGRTAGTLAGMSDSAAIALYLRGEIRAVRQQMADAFRSIAERAAREAAQ